MSWLTAQDHYNRGFHTVRGGIDPRELLQWFGAEVIELTDFEVYFIAQHITEFRASNEPSGYKGVFI